MIYPQHVPQPLRDLALDTIKEGSMQTLDQLDEDLQVWKDSLIVFFVLLSNCICNFEVTHFNGQIWLQQYSSM